MRSNRIVVFTALSEEARAVRALLPDLDTLTVPPGTIVEHAPLPDTGYTICLVTMGPGVGEAAVIAERVISWANPAAVLLVGIAGGLKDDLSLGDVVAARRVLYHPGGKDSPRGFWARPEAWPASHRLLQIAQYVESRGSWLTFLPDDGTQTTPNIHLKPIASGDVVKATNDSPLAELLHTSYNDASAIEMEAAGVARAAHHHGVELLVIRGISDPSDSTKTPGADAEWQPRAARHAAAFALGVIRAMPAPASGPGISTPDNFGVEMSDTDANEPDWSQLDQPLAVAWRTDLYQTWAAEPSTLEVHLVPTGSNARVQAARLQPMWDELVQIGCSQGMFAYGQAVDGNGDLARGAIAFTRATRGVDNSGLAILRTGQRSAWETLPQIAGMSVAIFDPADIAARLTGMLQMLLKFPVPLAANIVPVAAIAPDQLITRSTVGTDHGGRATLRTMVSPLRTEATEAVSADRLRHAITAVADELAARLNLAFDTRQN